MVQKSDRSGQSSNAPVPEGYFGDEPEILDVEGWEPVKLSEGAKLDWDRGMFTGTFLGMDTITDPNTGEMFERARFLGTDNERYWCYPGYILKQALKEVKPDSLVRIVPRGEVEMKGKSPMRTFDVYVRKA